jgi:hypothetical protein
VCALHPLLNAACAAVLAIAQSAFLTLKVSGRIQMVAQRRSRRVSAGKRVLLTIAQLKAAGP